MIRLAARATSVLAALSLLAGGVVLTGAGPSQAIPGDFAFPGWDFGAIPDGGPCTSGPVPGPPRDVRFTVTGLVHWAPADVRVTGVALHHPYLGDVVATLIAPDGTSHVLFGRTGATTATGTGDSSDLGGTVSFIDGLAFNWWTEAAAAGFDQIIRSGSYRTSAIGGPGSTGAITSLTGAFGSVRNPNGTWTLRLTDGCFGDLGSVTEATLELVSAPPCTPEQSAVTAAQAQVASSGAATTAAAADAVKADQAVQVAALALAKAEKAVDKAKRKLKRAKDSGSPLKFKRAKAKLKKAKKALEQAKAELETAQHNATTAHQKLTSAEATATAAQAALTAAQAALAAC
jgi:subtilisin-like proprotein convertase family protein